MEYVHGLGMVKRTSFFVDWIPANLSENDRATLIRTIEAMRGYVVRWHLREDMDGHGTDEWWQAVFQISFTDDAYPVRTYYSFVQEEIMPPVRLVFQVPGTTVQIHLLKTLLKTDWATARYDLAQRQAGAPVLISQAIETRLRDWVSWI